MAGLQGLAASQTSTARRAAGPAGAVAGADRRRKAPGAATTQGPGRTSEAEARLYLRASGETHRGGPKRVLGVRERYRHCRSHEGTAVRVLSLTVLHGGDGEGKALRRSQRFALLRLQWIGPA